MKNNLPIGIFDSGLGGLTVLKALQQILPNESFLYIGDTAHVPYGNKSKEAVTKYSEKITQFLIDNKVKLIIVACNTASSVAIKHLQANFSIPIIDVITPLGEVLKDYKHNQIKAIGVIGTYNTINSKAYDKIILQYNNTLSIISKACPLFVPIIEEGLQNHTIAKNACKKYLSDFNNQKIDFLILGCTHYPIMAATIQKTLNKDITIIDSAKTTAEYIENYLMHHNLMNKQIEKNKTVIMVTDKTLRFKQFAQNILSDYKLDILEVAI